MNTDRLDYGTILNLIPDGVLTVDREMKVLQINNAACRLLGIREAGELIDRPVSLFMEEAPFLRLRDGEKAQFSDRIQLSGENFWLDRSFLCDRERTYFVCTLHDVTPVLQQEETILRSRLRAAELADAINEKQLHLVHEIAGLLGEAATETQAVVGELKKAVLPGTEGKNG